MACHSEEPRLIILLLSSILGCGPQSGQQRTTGRQKSQDRETPHWNSVCMSWGGGRAVLPHVPCQAHSIPEFECHQLHTASSSSLLFVMTAPPGVWTHLFMQAPLLSMLPLSLLADPEQKIGCLINSPRIAQCSFFLGQLYLVGKEQWPWS